LIQMVYKLEDLFSAQWRTINSLQKKVFSQIHSINALRRKILMLTSQSKKNQ